MLPKSDAPLPSPVKPETKPTTRRHSTFAASISLTLLLCPPILRGEPSQPEPQPVPQLDSFEDPVLNNLAADNFAVMNLATDDPVMQNLAVRSHAHDDFSIDNLALDAMSAPHLANTDETDRPMLVEVPDSHVYRGAPVVPVLVTTSSRMLDEHESGEDWASVEVIRQRSELLRLVQGDSGSNPASSSSSIIRRDLPAWEAIATSTRIAIPREEAIADYLARYRKEAMWISRILERATPFIGHLVDELDERYLPVELALLPAIESGFQVSVVSTGQAAGLWQIVPLTAKEIGLERNVWFDGRSDIVHSTRAALDYLRFLNAEFQGDWELTLAAYNAGPGRVRRAVERNRLAGFGTDFWSLKLPRETREYVPKYLALLALVREHTIDPVAELEIPEVARGTAFTPLDFEQRVSVDRVAQALDVPESELRRLNAGLVHGVTPPNGPHFLYLPGDDINGYADRIATGLPSALYSLPLTHTVKAGDTISGIAEKYHISQQRLRELNALEDSSIFIGQKLAVLDVSTQRTTGRIEYVVTIGDTLSDIAARFSVNLTDIHDADGKVLESDVIHPGVTLSIDTGKQAVVDTDDASDIDVSVEDNRLNG